MKTVKVIALLLGIGLISWMIVDTGPDKIWQEVSRLGPWIWLFFVPYIATYFCDSLGWKFCFLPEITLPYLKLFRVRLAGEAINYTTPTAYLGGEPIKALILKKSQGLPLSHGLASVIIAKFMMTVAEVFFILISLPLTLLNLGHSDFLWGSLLFAALFSCGLALFLLLQRKGLGRILRKGLGGFNIASTFFAKQEDALREFDAVLAAYYRSKRQVLFSCMSFFLGWCCGAVEIYILMKLTNNSMPLYMIFGMEAIFVTIKGAGFLVPGSVGVQEGGITGAFVLLGFRKELGLTFSLLRRLREVLWIIVGMIFLFQEWDSSLAIFAGKGPGKK